MSVGINLTKTPMRSGALWAIILMLLINLLSFMFFPNTPTLQTNIQVKTPTPPAETVTVTEVGGLFGGRSTVTVTTTEYYPIQTDTPNEAKTPKGSTDAHLADPTRFANNVAACQSKFPSEAWYVSWKTGETALEYCLFYKRLVFYTTQLQLRGCVGNICKALFPDRFDSFTDYPYARQKGVNSDAYIRSFYLEKTRELGR